MVAQIIAHGEKGPGGHAQNGPSMTGIQRIRLEGVLPPPVSHYCDAVRAGDVLFISGIVAVDQDGRVIGKGDSARQAEQIFEYIGRVLAYVGADFSKIASVLIHLTDMDDRARINPVRVRYFGEHRPASTLVQVTSLIHPDLLVEITSTAYLGA
jgi:2-iminobutanoate/2-iminopropanoate deaminase